MYMPLAQEEEQEEAITKEGELLLEKIGELFRDGKVNIFQLRAMVNQATGNSLPPGKVARGH
jgi:hypothetical protein